MTPRKPKAVVMWAYWHPADSSPFWRTMSESKEVAQGRARSAFLYASRVVKVELSFRRLPSRRAGKKGKGK